MPDVDYRASKVEAVSVKVDKLTKKVVIQSKEAGNELDGVPESWNDVGNFWAMIQPLTGREYEQAQQMQSNTTHKIKTRWFEGANSAMRLVRGNRVFEVESVVNEFERNRWLIWRCSEVPQ